MPLASLMQMAATKWRQRGNLGGDGPVLLAVSLAVSSHSLSKE